MKRKQAYKIRLGAFILGALVLLLGLLAYMGSRRNLFSPTIELNGNFSEVSGLRSGNNVVFSGISIGVVKSVEIINDTVIRVVTEVDKKTARFIKADSKMLISSEGLMGSKVLTISSGSTEARSVEDGDYLETERPFDIEEIMLVFKSAGHDISEVARNIKGITEEIQQGQGFAGKILTDPEFAAQVETAVQRFRESGESARAFTGDLNRLSSDVRSGKGALGVLLQDEQTAERMRVTIDSLELTVQRTAKISRNLEAFTDDMSKDSPVGRLLHDEEMGEDLKNTIENLEGNTAEFNETMESIRGSWLVRGLFRKKKERGDTEQQE